MAQTRSGCHCPSCVSPTQALARRSTIVASKRRLRFRDVFTAFYSAALATAAVADGNLKEARRQDLDKSINQAKGELEALKGAQHKRLQALSSRTDKGGIRDESEEDQWAAVFRWEAEETRRRAALGFQDLKGLPLSILDRITKKELDEILLEDRQQEILEYRLQPRNEREVWQREPHALPLSDKKMKLLAWSIAKMVLKMLHLTAKDSGSQDASSIEKSPSGIHVGPQSIDFSREVEVIQKHICSIRGTPTNSREIANIESPRFPRYTTTQNMNPEDPRSLNGSIRDTFLSIKGGIRYQISKTEKPCIESVVAKVCSRLLTSSTAPNVHTYNLLLVHLLRLGQYDLVSLVIDSMAEFYLRPNEITVRLSLAFYRVVRDRKGFSSYVDKMKGKNDGLALAHPHVRITAVNERHYKRSCRSVHYGKDENPNEFVVNGVDPVVHGSKMKIIERAHRNQEVFDQLIKGALEFWGLEKATKIYRSMIEEGWEANGTVLGCILRHCWKTLDWPTAKSLWQRLTILGTPMIKKLYPVMLCICLAHDQQHEYNKIRKACLDSGLFSDSRDILPFAVARLCTKLDKQSLIRRLELRIEFIGRKICYTATKLANIKGTTLRDSPFEKKIHADMTELNFCLTVGLENTTLMQGTTADEQNDTNIEQKLSREQCTVHQVPPNPPKRTYDHPLPEPTLQRAATSCPPATRLLDSPPPPLTKEAEDAFRNAALHIATPSTTNQEASML